MIQALIGPATKLLGKFIEDKDTKQKIAFELSTMAEKHAQQLALAQIELNKAEAQSGYNDDLVMSFSMGLFLRDTSLKFKQTGDQLTIKSIEGIGKTTAIIGNRPGWGNQTQQNPYEMKDNNGNIQNLVWLL